MSGSATGELGPRLVGPAGFATDLPGSPVTVEVLAESLARRLLPVLDDARRGLEMARAEVAAAWQGRFARRTHEVLGDVVEHARAVRDRVAGTVAGLRAYAERLRQAQRGLAQLRVDAAAAGLDVSTAGVVSAPPDRECDVVPFLERARALYRLAEPGDLPETLPPPDALGVLLLAPGAATTVDGGLRAEEAQRLRVRATTLEDAAASRALVARADDLVADGRALGWAATGVTTPLGLVLDVRGGETWTQAGASQGAGVVAGALASAGTTAALSAPTGPGALLVGVAAFGAGMVAGGAANSAVDRRFAASRRGPAERLIHQCGTAGRRHRAPTQSKYGVRESDR